MNALHQVYLNSSALVDNFPGMHLANIFASPGPDVQNSFPKNRLHRIASHWIEQFRGKSAKLNRFKFTAVVNPKLTGKCVLLEVFFGSLLVPVVPFEDKTSLIRKTPIGARTLSL